MRDRVPILLISIAIIGFQLAIVNLLSYSQWHHFAYLAVSVAMLGFGSSGVLIAIWKKFFLNRLQSVLPFLFVATGISMFIAPLLINSEFLRFDSLLLFTSTKHLFKLLATCIVLLIPFLTGALALGLFFTAYNQQISKLYAYNLAGSALGGVILIWMSNIVFPMSLASTFGLVAVLGAPFVSYSKRNIVYSSLALFLGIFVLWVQPSIPFTSQYKPLSKTILIPDTHITEQMPLSKGTLEFVTSSNLRQANGLSLSYSGSVPLVDMAFLNAQPYFTFEKNEADSSFYTSNIYALPYILTNYAQNILLIQPSSTFYISQANVFGYSPTIIEPIKYIADTLTKLSWKYGDIKIKHSYPRQVLHSHTLDKWDIIMFPSVGNTGNSGLNALMENYLFTTNAVANSFNTLNDNGFIVFSSVMDNPPRSNLKLISLVSHSLHNLSLEPEEHLLSIRTWNTLVVLIKKSSLNPEDIDRVRVFCETYGFDLVHPYYDNSEHNILMDNQFQLISSQIIGDNFTKSYDSYPFNLEAPSDNSPFFSQFVKLSKLKYYTDEFGLKSVTHLELGYFIIWVSFIICLIISLLAIITPAFTTFQLKKQNYWIYLYFSFIGLAYMMLEVAFIQRSILSLNNPTMASSIVISSLLCFSAIGSYFSSNLTSSRITQLLLAIGIYIVIYALFAHYIISWVASQGLAIRIASTILSIAPLAMFMGTIFPMGIKIISSSNPNQIPVAWAVNGFFSVLAAPLATITAVEYGFYQVLIFSAFLYLLCIPLVYKRASNKKAPTFVGA